MSTTTISGRVKIQVGSATDEYGNLASSAAGHLIPHVPAGIIVELDLGDAASLCPWFAHRILPMLHNPREIHVTGTNGKAVADAIQQLRSAHA